MLAFSLALVCASAPAKGQQHSFYRLASAVRLPGAAPSWDYLVLDTAQQRLFIARRGAGVTVYDIAANKVLRGIDRSAGANATTLVHAFGRGYTTNEDGSTTIFSLSTLETLDRVKLGDDADASIYEPKSRLIAFTMGDSKAIALLDAASGVARGRITMPSAKLDGTVVDGRGNIFVAMRDRNAIARVDPALGKMTAEWKVKGCDQPTGLAIDTTHHRLFIGCRGARPVLAVMDALTGGVITTHTIGRGNDGVVYDPIRQQVLTSNGVDANLVVFQQTDADHYALAEAVTTRPFARTMAFDARSQTVYLVTAEGVADPAMKVNTAVSPFYPNRYFDDTFTLLTYRHP